MQLRQLGAEMHDAKQLGNRSRRVLNGNSCTKWLWQCKCLELTLTIETGHFLHLCVITSCNNVGNYNGVAAVICDQASCGGTAGGKMEMV